MPVRRTRRVSLALATAAALGASLLTLAAPAQATSSIGGQVSSVEILSRAQTWVDKHVPYDQQGYAADPQGRDYREDCSGFVSMAWHLDKSLVVTDGGPAFTNADGSPNTTYDTAVGDFSNLQPGDAMAYPHEHIFLFAGWTDKAAGDFLYYAESNTNDPTHGPSKANIRSTSIEGHPTSGYVALRYKNVSNAPTTPPASPTPRSSSSGLSVTPDSGYVTTWRGSDGKLWMGTGGGTYMAKPAAPWLLGVAENSKPSIATMTDGTWTAAWAGDDGKLWIGTGSGTNMAKPAAPWLLGVFPGTSPSITALPNGSYEVAWKGGDGRLWLATGSGTNMAQPAEPWLLGVADTTSPSLAALPGGGWEVAWKGDDGRLWIGTGSGTNMAKPASPWLLGVGTSGSSSSPSLVTMADGSYEVAWKGGDGRLWLATGSGTNMAQPAEPWLLGVADTTSPSLAALPGGGWEVAWKGDDGRLWIGTGSGTNMAKPASPWLLGVGTNGSSSSPSLVTMADGSYEVAWKGGDGRLWLATGSGTNMAQPAEPWLLGVA
ncbi:hypothetical protein ACWCWQ_12980 [Streptomyces sp. NPDC001571]